ncbi:MAG: methyltransferase domain-containing protein [Pseudomonadota bacterium]
MATPSTNLECQLCGERTLKPFVVPDRSHLQLCDACELYQHGTPAKEQYYDGDYHASYASNRARKTRTAVYRLNRIATHLDGRPDATRPPRLLDIGCSVGSTVEAAARRGWQAVGVDVSADAVRFCQELGLDAHHSDGLVLPFADE